MMRSRSIALASSGAGLFALVASAVAQPMPPTQGGRYSMHPADGGVIRLDTETGAMSMCKAGAGGQWQCESLPDEKAALDKEIARLVKENRELQRRAEDGGGLPRPAPGESRRAESDRPFGNVPLPTEQDVDKAMSYLHGMMKKFRSKLKEFEDLYGGDGKRIERL